MIDAIGLGKPEVYNGTAAKWRDWNGVTRSYRAACNGGISALKTTAEETEEARSPSGARKASEQLAFISVMICRAECAQCRPPKAFHIKVPGFFCSRSGTTGDTSEAGITGRGEHHPPSALVRLTNLLEQVPRASHASL